jgi:serine protease Do
MKTLRTLAQQVGVSLLVVWLWRTFEGDANRRWDNTYESSDNAVVEVVSADSGLAREGTGFLIRHSGHVVIVTNEHVIHGARALKLRFRDSVTVDADVVDSSSTNDLATLRVKGVNLERYSPLTAGASSDLQIGDELMTIGHPLRESHHLSIGLYAGKDRLDELGTMLRLNMPVDPGNSGGPLLNNRGRVVGVVTLKDVRASSLAFAVPIENLEKLKVP